MTARETKSLLLRSAPPSQGLLPASIRLSPSSRA